MRCRGVIPDVPVARPAIHSATAAAAAGGGLRPPSSDFKFLPAVFSDSRPSLFNKVCPSVGWSKTGIQLENHRMKTFRVKALEASGESQTPIAPLQFESPMGQLLSQIMQTDPHLLPAAVDQQLERLQSDRNALKEEKPPSSQQNLLYKIITTSASSSPVIYHPTDYADTASFYVNGNLYSHIDESMRAH